MRSRSLEREGLVHACRCVCRVLPAMLWHPPHRSSYFTPRLLKALSIKRPNIMPTPIEGQGKETYTCIRVSICALILSATHLEGSAMSLAPTSLLPMTASPVCPLSASPASPQDRESESPGTPLNGHNPSPMRKCCQDIAVHALHVLRQRHLLTRKNPTAGPLPPCQPACPILCHQDITLRALHVLRAASVVLAEDTRHTGRLLSAYGIPPPELMSYHAHNERARAAAVVRRLAGGSEVVALVSDAGTPGISDPGAVLVQVRALVFGRARQWGARTVGAKVVSEVAEDICVIASWELSGMWCSQLGAQWKVDVNPLLLPASMFRSRTGKR
eukprot:357233-Chlamydomonas_euryale.AAC.5